LKQDKESKMASWDDIINGIKDILGTSVAIHIAGAMSTVGGGYLIPVAAVLAQVMHTHGTLGKGRFNEPSPRQVSLAAGDLNRQGLKIIRRKDGYYIRI
jgi:hypothetical protein